jgi:MFS family permease
MASQSLKKTFLPVLFAISIDAMGYGLVYPVMTLIFTSTHCPVLPESASLATRHFYLGLSFLLYPLCMFFGAAFLADCSDRWGRRRILLLCLLGIALSFALMGWGVMANSLGLLLLGRALSGLMAGSQPVAQAAIADASQPENKALHMSWMSLSYCFGVMLGPLIGGVTSDTGLWSGFSLPTPFFIAALLALLAWLWLLLVFFPREVSQGAGKPLHWLRPLQLFVEGLRHKRLRCVAAAFFLIQLGWSLYFQFIVVHMKLAFHYTGWQLGTINSLFGIGFALGLLLGMPWLVKRYATAQIARLTTYLTATCLLLAALAWVAWPQWPLAILTAGMNIMLFTAMLTLFSDSVDDSQQGWAMGLSSAVIALAWVVTGLCSNLINLVGTQGLIALGAVCLFVATMGLRQVTKR